MKMIAESLKQAQEAKENGVVDQGNEVIADKISENKCGVQLAEETPSSRHAENFRILQGENKKLIDKLFKELQECKKKGSGISRKRKQGR